MDRGGLKKSFKAKINFRIIFFYLFSYQQFFMPTTIFKCILILQSRLFLSGPRIQVMKSTSTLDTDTETSLGGTIR